MLKGILSVLSVLIILTGGVWILQGIGILPGSFMTGRSEWALYGGIAVIIGAALLVFALTRKRGGSVTKD